MNDLKEAKHRALQSCLKVTECPTDTARFLVQASANHRQFLTNAAAVADLLIVDVAFDQLSADVDFSETRLAGLIR